MHFLLNQNVARAVADMLISKGHTCEFSRALIPADAPDPIVAIAAEETGAILVSHDTGFNSIAARVVKGQKNRFRKLSRVALQCSEAIADRRLRECLPIGRADRSGRIDIGPSGHPVHSEIYDPHRLIARLTYSSTHEETMTDTRHPESYLVSASRSVVGCSSSATGATGWTTRRRCPPAWESSRQTATCFKRSMMLRLIGRA
jgi:predicted nuclease of predicted toxin-antitoxin system